MTNESEHLDDSSMVETESLHSPKLAAFEAARLCFVSHLCVSESPRLHLSSVHLLFPSATRHHLTLHDEVSRLSLFITLSCEAELFLFWFFFTF